MENDQLSEEGNQYETLTLFNAIMLCLMWDLKSLSEHVQYIFPVSLIVPQATTIQIQRSTYS